MSWSGKTRDLRRDPRCVLHSVITAPNAGEAELKLYGRAVQADPAIRDGCRDGWWNGHPADVASVFSLAIDRATLIEWDTTRGEMTVHTWSLRTGLSKADRSYP
jgi:hypothetical protein